MILLTGSYSGRTLRGMGGQRAAMIGGGLWSLFRFAVISLLVLRLVPNDPLFHISLLWVGGPSLLLVALFGSAAFLREGRRYYLPLLRIGMLLAAVTDAVVVLTGSYIPVAERVGTSSDPVTRFVFIIVYGILAVDLLILAALISYRSMDTNHAPESTDDTRPDYEATHVEDE